MEDKIVQLINSIDRLTNAVEDKLMTAKDIAESPDFKIGYRTVLELFRRPDFPVVEYVKPKKVLRSNLVQYIKTHPTLNK